MSKTPYQYINLVGKNLKSETNLIRSLTETNLFSNYDFKTTTGITVLAASAIRENGIITLTLNNKSSMNMGVIFNQGTVFANHVYYVSAKIIVPNIKNLLYAYIGLAGATWQEDKDIDRFYMAESGELFISATFRPSEYLAENLKVVFGYFRDDASYTDDAEVISITRPVLLDLTESYGEGKEPTKDVMDFCIETASFEENGIISRNTTIFDAVKHVNQSFKLNKMSFINAKEKYNLDNTGMRDMTSLIRKAVSELEPNHVLFFPTGIYLISDGFVLPNHTGIVGENGRAFDKNGTIFKVAPGTANITVFSGTSTWTTHLYKNFSISSSSFTFTTTEVASSDNSVADRYSWTENDSGVNGISLRYGNTIVDDVDFFGLSGIALDGYIYNYITNVHFSHCAEPFNIMTDNYVENVRIVDSKQGLHINGTANTVIGLRTDGIGTHSLILDGNGNENIIDDIEFDQNNWAGIYISGCMYNVIRGLGGRVGQYYGGFSPSNVTVGEEYKGAVVYLKNARYNMIDFTSGYYKLFDLSTTESKGPLFKIVSSGECYNNVFNIVGFTKSSLNSVTTGSYHQDSAEPISIDEVKEIIKPIDGKYNGVIMYNGKKLVAIAENGVLDFSKTSCNGVCCYNTSDVSTLTPSYLGQMLVYNNKLYIANSLNVGGWKSL